MSEVKRGPKGGIIGLDDPEELPAPGEARVTLWRCKDCGDLSTRSRSHNHGSVGVRDLKMREPVKFVIASRLERAEEALRRAREQVTAARNVLRDTEPGSGEQTAIQFLDAALLYHLPSHPKEPKR